MGFGNTDNRDNLYIFKRKPFSIVQLIKSKRNSPIADSKSGIKLNFLLDSFDATTFQLIQNDF